MAATDLHQRHPGAVAWSFVMTGGQVTLTTAMQFVLAAIVGPEAFGLVALALIYVMFVQILLDQGLGTAIIQREDLRDDHLDSGFWMMIGVSAMLTVASIGLARWWAEFNRIPDLEPVVIALSLLIPFRALTVVQEAILRRELHYRSLAIRANVAVLASGTVGITTALMGAGVWALVYEQLTNAGVELLVLWSVSHWRPRFRFSRARVSELLSFSLGSFLAAAGTFALTRVESLVMGRFFGATAVGLYRFAWRIVNSVLDVVVRSLQNVAFSFLSRLQDDREAFADSTIHTTRIGAILVAPILGVVAGAGPDLLAVVGDEWAPAGTALRLLCLQGLAAVLTYLVSPILNALGHPYRYAVFVWTITGTALAAFVTLGVVMEGDEIGSQLLAIALANVVMFAVITGMGGTWIISHHIGVDWRRLIAPFVRPVAAGLLAFGAVLGVNSLGVEGIEAPFARLLVTGGSGTAVAVAAVLVLDPHARSALAAGRDRLRGPSPPIGPA